MSVRLRRPDESRAAFGGPPLPFFFFQGSAFFFFIFIQHTNPAPAGAWAIGSPTTALWPADNAASDILATRSGKAIPLAKAALGKRLVAVKPGIVLTSRIKGLFVLSRIISTREKNEQPSRLCALSAVSFNNPITSQDTGAGTIYSVCPGPYLAW